MSYPYNIVNWTFWVILVLVAAYAWIRFLQNRKGPGALAAALVGSATFMVVLAALRLAYVSPLANVQDIVAARQALKGEPLPTTGIQSLVKETLAAEPRPATLKIVWPWLSAAIPGLSMEEQREFDRISDVTKVQAHPPFATLFFVPIAYSLGVYKSSIGLALLSILCIVLTLLMLHHGLQLNLSLSQKAFFCFLFIGWYPMFWNLRSAQLSVFLSMLVVGGWYGVRRDRPILGGIAIGIAASLKLFPALLLIYFLFRQRRALWSAGATIIMLNALTLAVFGLNSYIEYSHTPSVVVEIWGSSHENWSLLGALRHSGEIFSIPALSSHTVFMVTALVIVVAICLMMFVAPRFPSSIHFEYSMFIVAMILLSPTCWYHYFVFLLLPLAVLANHAVQRGTLVSVTMFLVLFLVFAMPRSLVNTLVSCVEPIVGPRASMALLLLFPLALLAMLVWLATLALTSPVAPHMPQAKESLVSLA